MMTTENKFVEILLVEDNPNDAEFALRAFKKHDLSRHVFVVKDGVEALDYLFATGKYSYRKITDIPKVVFLDIKLPKIDGIEVLRRLKARKETAIIPIVMVTSSKEEQDINASYKLGASSYFVKPLEFDKFIESIAELAKYWLRFNISPQVGAPVDR